MGWEIERTDEGTWRWSCFQSAYGCGSGETDSFNAAKVELLIAEASIMESPYPPVIRDAMRADPDRFGAGLEPPEPEDGYAGSYSEATRAQRRSNPRRANL